MKATLLSLAILLSLATINARAGESHDDARKLTEAGTILPLENILERVRKEHSGKLLDTELEHKGNRYIYEIKIADDKGTVWELKVDAATGNLLKEKKEH